MEKQYREMIHFQQENIENISFIPDQLKIYCVPLWMRHIILYSEGPLKLCPQSLKNT